MPLPTSTPPTAFTLSDDGAWPADFTLHLLLDAMRLFSDPAILDGLGYGLLTVGLVGLIALIISDADRRLSKRVLGVVLAVIAIGGGSLVWRAESIRQLDRSLSPEQQANLSRAIGQFPTVRFEVYAVRADKEVNTLALKVADAVKAAQGTPPVEGTVPSAPKGVVLVMRNDETDLARTIRSTVGRVLMAARIAAMSSHAPELDDNVVLIVIGPKP